MGATNLMYINGGARTHQGDIIVVGVCHQPLQLPLYLRNT
jgi:hypothetical protein